MLKARNKPKSITTAMHAAQHTTLGVATPLLQAGAGNAASNTAALLAAIALNGRVRIDQVGEIYINNTLWLDNNQDIQAGPATWLRLAAGTNKKLVALKPESEAAASISISWSSGLQATVTWTGHGRAAGDAIVVQGANEADWNDVFRVLAAPDANTLTIGLREFVTAGPTGTLTARRCVRNLFVRLNLDYDYPANPSAPASTDRHCMSAAFVADSEIHVVAKNGYKYGLLVCGALNVRGSINGTGVSDIIKVYGPSTDVHFQVSGVSKDDSATFQALEAPAFLAYMPAAGPIRSCTYRDIEVNGTGGSASGAVVIYADPTYETDNIVIDGGSAMSRLRAGLSIKYGDTYSTGNLKKISARNLRLGPLATNYCISFSASMDVLHIRDVVLVPGDDVSQLVRQESTSTVRVVIFENVVFNEPLWPSAAGSVYMVNLNGAANTAIFKNCSIRGRSSQARFLTVGTNGVRSVIFDGCDIENMSQLMIHNNAAVAPRIVLTNGTRLKNVTTGIDCRGNATVILENCEFDTVPNGVVRPTTNAITVDVHERGCVFTSASAITCVAPAQAVPRSLTLPVDIGATGIIKAAGALAYNTGTGRGTVAQNRAVTCNGTSWVQVDTPTNTF